MRSREIKSATERASVRLENIYHCRQIWLAKQDRKRQIREDNARETASLTPSQRLARLDERLGRGVGAKRERARLEAALVAA